MNEQSRLLWRCRRGMREMDLLLEQFVNKTYSRLDSEEQRQFEIFLDETDADLLAWITGSSEPDNPVYKKFVQRLRQLRPEGLNTDPLNE